jgi:hypothetical protein
MTFQESERARTMIDKFQTQNFCNGFADRLANIRSAEIALQHAAIHLGRLVTANDEITDNRRDSLIDGEYPVDGGVVVILDDAAIIEFVPKTL